MLGDAWFLLVFPGLFGLYGGALLLNLFGSAEAEADFYRGRDYWYPVMKGDETGTHRVAGLLMLLFAIALTVAIVRM